MSEILDIKDIKRLLSDRVLTVVKQKTGLSYNTLQALQRGEERQYNIGTLRVISDYLTNK